jgi:hypothetical protein
MDTTAPDAPDRLAASTVKIHQACTVLLGSAEDVAPAHLISALLLAREDIQDHCPTGPVDPRLADPTMTPHELLASAAADIDSAPLPVRRTLGPARLAVTQAIETLGDRS